MKINPIGVQSYQNLARRDNPAAVKPDGQDQSAKTVDALSIAPQEQPERPRMAVRPIQASYADNLSPEEQRAMELLFSRFHDTSRFGPGYAKDSQAAPTDDPGVGNLVDLKA